MTMTSLCANRRSYHRLYSSLLCLALLVLSTFFADRSCGADIQIDRDVMTVTTENLIAVFRGQDLVRLSNRLTKEQYLRPPIPFSSLFDLKMTTDPTHRMRGDFWRVGKNESAAQFILNDSRTRSAWMNVIIDPDTQDITITLWAETNREGVRELTWGIRGLDLTGGRFVLPVQGGRYADDTTKFSDVSFEYPGEWEAQVAIWESKQGGGFVLYSRDNEARPKRLHLARQGNHADMAFDMEAVAPYEKTGGVPVMEWRINTFKGDWRVPGSGYRNLMNFFRKPVPWQGKRAWVKEVQAVATMPGKEFDLSLLDALAKKVDAPKMLLYLPDWRRDGYDPNTADYTPRDNVRPFVEHAHELGFHVMLPLPPPGCDPKSSDYSLAQRYLVRDEVTGQKPAAPAPTFAVFNTSATAYRSLLIQRLKVMMDDVLPDALLLPGAAALANDGHGLIEAKNCAQGMMTLQRALLTAFPDLVLGGEGMNELISPYNAFALRSARSSLPPHPVATGLFGGQVFAFGNPESTTPGDAAIYAAQGIAPVFVVRGQDDLKGELPKGIPLKEPK